MVRFSPDRTCYQNTYFASAIETEQDENQGLETESGFAYILRDSNKEVMSGTLNGLIAWLTSPSCTGAVLCVPFSPIVFVWRAFVCACFVGEKGRQDSKPISFDETINRVQLYEYLFAYVSVVHYTGNSPP